MRGFIGPRRGTEFAPEAKGLSVCALRGGSFGEGTKAAREGAMRYPEMGARTRENQERKQLMHMFVAQRQRDSKLNFPKLCVLGGLCATPSGLSDL